MLRFCPIILLAAFFPLHAAEDVAARAAAILKDNCAGCHGAGLKMSNLDLRSRESMLAGGERGPAIEPGKAANSRLYRFAAGIEKPGMPPGKPLSASDVEVLRQWIDEGAVMAAPKNDQPDQANDALA